MKKSMKKSMLGSLALLSVLPMQSFAHGSIEVPISRVYNCYKEGPEAPVSAACKAAVAAGGTQAFYDWNAVRIGDANGHHRDLIPDGKLCSAGSVEHQALDLARNDWVSKRIAPNSAGRFDFVYNATAQHATRYFQFYVTRAGYNPLNPLKWSDLEATPFCEVTSVTAVNGRYTLNCPFPTGKQGRHVIYNIWQRSDSPEAFYACIDVDFGTTAMMTTSSWKELNQLQARESLGAGSKVLFRVFDAAGRDAERHELRLQADTPADQWLVQLARQINASSQLVRVGALDDAGQVVPREARQGNSVYVKQEGYSFQLDLEKPSPSTPPQRSDTDG